MSEEVPANVRRTDDRVVKLNFDNCPFPLAMQQFTIQTGAVVVWSKDCDELTVSGVYSGQCVADVLGAIARRAGQKLSLLDSVYYIGAQDKTDFITVVLRAPSTESTKLQENLQKIVSENGSVSVDGGILIINDCYENLLKICSVIDNYRDMLSRGYIAEIYFFRCCSKDLIDLQAKLEAKGIDILGASWSIGDLFACYIDADGERSNIVLEDRPIMFLSEGRQSVFEVGSEITLEKKSISTEGYVSTSGYEKFSDGVKITLNCKRVNKGLYACDFDLHVSKFEDEGDIVSGVVPQNDKAILTCPGLLCPDGGVILVGSLNQHYRAKKLSLITGSTDKDDEIITIWLRVREIDLKSKNLLGSSIDRQGIF